MLENYFKQKKLISIVFLDNINNMLLQLYSSINGESKKCLMRHKQESAATMSFRITRDFLIKLFLPYVFFLFVM